MRVLFTTIAARSHLHPQVPLAWALRSAGHDVRVASQPDLVEDITAAGLTAVPIGEPIDQEVAARELAEAGDADPATQWLDWPQVLDIATAGDIDRDYAQGVLAAYTPLIFQYYSNQMFDDLAAFTTDWRPDLVLWDTMAFAGPVAAMAARAVHGRVLFGLDLLGRMRQRYQCLTRDLPPGRVDDPLREWLEPILAGHGCRFTEEAVLGRFTVDPVPAPLRLPVDHPYLPMRYVPYNGAASVPQWLRDPPRRRRVCITLGVSNREIFGSDRVSTAELLAAVADLDVEVVATLDAGQLAKVGDVPDNVRAVPFVPLDVLLPTCAAIVHHGGSGTSLTAIAHGVPQVVIPDLLWDTGLRGRHLQRTGAGLYVRDTGRCSAATIRDLLVRVLETPGYAAGAARLRAAMLAAPPPSDVVADLERQVSDSPPSTATTIPVA